MKKIPRNKIKIGQYGFTIVEVMIATLIFTIVLTGTIFLIINFTNRYYKAVNSSTTQNTTRTILADVTKAIEFTTSPVSSTKSGNDTTYCMDDQQFDFNNVFLNPTDPTQTGNLTIWETPDSGSSCPSITSPVSASQVLLGTNLQVINFQICLLGQTGSNCLNNPPAQPTYSVNLVVSYGPDRLICDTTQYASCTGSGKNTGIIAPDGYSDTFGCIDSQGTQYCDVVDLTADVQTRLQMS